METETPKLDAFDTNLLECLAFDHFQAGARGNRVYNPKELPEVVYSSLGLAGEAGEFADKVKKLYRDAHGVMSEERKKALLLELGDVLWYVADAATSLRTSLSTVAQMNIEKLAARRARGATHGSGDNR